MGRKKSSPSLVGKAELIQLLLKSAHLLLHGIIHMLEGRGLYLHMYRFRLEGKRETQTSLRVNSSSMEGLAERWKGRSNIGRVLERSRGHSY